MVYNGYYKVMSNIPKMGQLPTPDDAVWNFGVVRTLPQDAHTKTYQNLPVRGDCPAFYA